MIQYNLRAPNSWQIASLICGMEPKKTKRVIKKLKNRDAKKKWSSRKVRGVSPEARKGVCGAKDF